MPPLPQHTPSDLIHFMESDFITWMDRYHREHPGELTPDETDESLMILAKKGIEHEKSFLASLQDQGEAATTTTSPGTQNSPSSPSPITSSNSVATPRYCSRFKQSSPPQSQWCSVAKTPKHSEPKTITSTTSN